MYLGIDLGTSEVKALVIDENHEGYRQPQRAAEYSAASSALVRTSAGAMVGGDGVPDGHATGKMRPALAGH